MISWKFKLWRSAGAAAAFGLAACGGEGGAQSGGEAGEGAVAVAGAGAAGEAGEAAIGEGGGERGEAGAASAYAGLDGDQLIALRLQHLKGFVLAAEAVAEAGAPADAAVLLQQGLLEVYEVAPDRFGALDAAPVRAAGDGGNLSPAEISQRLRAGAAAIDAARRGVEIDYADLAVRMTDIAAGLYQNVVQADFVDPIEYQHSLGAALAARDALVAGRSALRGRNAGAYEEALAETERLIALWPTPTAPETPSSYRNVLAQSSRVRLALSPYL